MSAKGDPYLRHDNPRAVEQYLESTVRAATPARLRLMLIERAVETANVLATKWAAKEQLGSNEYSIKLLDLLNELLGGVVGGKGASEVEVCQKVADLYVFLVQHLIAAEPNSDASAVAEIRMVLEVEAETWRAVCAQAHSAMAPSSTGQAGHAGLNLEG